MKFLGGIVALALLSACVQTGVRFVDDRTAVISGRGNGYTSPNQVQKKVLEQAATLTLSRGFTRFTILDSRDAGQTNYAQMPSTSNTQGNFNAQPTYGGGVAGSYSSNTTSIPGAVIPIYMPGMDVMIRMFSDADAPPGAWDANALAPKKK